MEGITQLWHLPRGSKKTSTAAGAEAEKKKNTASHCLFLFISWLLYCTLRVLLLDDFWMHKRQREKRSSAVTQARRFQMNIGEKRENTWNEYDGDESWKAEIARAPTSVRQNKKVLFSKKRKQPAKQSSRERERELRPIQQGGSEMKVVMDSTRNITTLA